MSVIHEHLTRLESELRMPHFVEDGYSNPTNKGIFAFDLPKEIVNDFLDLRGHICIANARKKMKVLSITSSLPGEGSSTIATNLAFLMAGGLSQSIDLGNGKSRMANKSQGLSREDVESRLGEFFTPDYRSILRTNSFKSAVDVMQATSNYGVKEQDVSASQSREGKGKATHRCEVLLIDSNMRRPNLHKFFGIKQEPGLAEILEKDRDWQEVIHTIKDSDLCVLTAGKNKANPAELFASDKMRRTVSILRREFNYIIFDSPSVLPSVDAISLALVVDGVILIVRAGQTRWEVAQNAKTKLLTAQANLLGVALNRQRSIIPEGLYKRLVK